MVHTGEVQAGFLSPSIEWEGAGNRLKSDCPGTVCSAEEFNLYFLGESWGK